jgi:thioredoxin-like negative regulator of GroEL
VSARHGASSVEEQAALEALRAQADRTGEEAAQTLAELAGRLADAGNPRNLVRRLAADARRNALRSVRGIPGKLVGQRRGATRAALAAVPVLVLAAGVAIAVVRRRQLSRY